MASAKIDSQLDLKITIKMEMTLAEAKALKEITGYRVEDFLAGYYKYLGKSYLKPHENGVKSLFNTIKESLPQQITEAERIIKAVIEIRK